VSIFECYATIFPRSSMADIFKLIEVNLSLVFVIFFHVIIFPLYIKPVPPPLTWCMKWCPIPPWRPSTLESAEPKSRTSDRTFPASSPTQTTISTHPCTTSLTLRRRWTTTPFSTSETPVRRRRQVRIRTRISSWSPDASKCRDKQ